MPDDNTNQAFSEKVTQQLPPEARELWAPMADSFNSQGPDGVKVYLDATRELLENQVNDLLEQYTMR